MHISVFLSLLFLYQSIAWSQTATHPTISSLFTESGFQHEVPLSCDSTEIIINSGFNLGYSELHEQALWVTYLLQKTELNGPFERSSSFRVDPRLKTGSADNADYKNSGYDRGHLAPAADMAYSELSMKNSFYYSNVSPQVPSFNRGIWKKLEEQFRDWSAAYDKCIVVTGPIFYDTCAILKIGPNQVSVPHAFYKIALVLNNDVCRAIGFIIPNTESSNELDDFAVSIDQIEATTCLDFFSTLTEDVENIIERELDINYWFSIK